MNLFANAPAAANAPASSAKSASPAAYVPDPRHARSRLGEILAEMKAAQRWPWRPAILTLHRETIWPYLYECLPDRAEADRWRMQIEAEAARLDANSKHRS